MKKRLTIVIAIIAIGGLIFVGESWSQQAAPQAPLVTSRPSAASSSDSNSPSDNLPADAYRRRRIRKSESVKTAQKIERLMNQLGEVEEQNASKVGQPGTPLISATLMSRTSTTLVTPGEAQKKVELTKQLEAAVAEGFDEDMKVREGELSKLEERLNKLRAQLDRRRKAKSEIIQLEVKVLVNEAAGLGFSGGPSQVRRKGFYGLFDSQRRSLDSDFDPPPRGLPGVPMMHPGPLDMR